MIPPTARPAGCSAGCRSPAAAPPGASSPACSSGPGRRRWCAG
ncbi:MAG: hypothetical protein ACK56I_20070 [bacterium]